jgi:hypothetical protein
MIPKTEGCGWEVGMVMEWLYGNYHSPIQQPDYLILLHVLNLKVHYKCRDRSENWVEIKIRF